MSDVTVDIGDDFVATVEVHRPPENYFDAQMIGDFADAYDALDADPRCRAIVLCSEGPHFCAGAKLGGGRRPAAHSPPYAPPGRALSPRPPAGPAVPGPARGRPTAGARAGDLPPTRPPWRP